MKEMKRILVPVDGSNSACKAVDYAFCLAAKSGAEIDFLYIANVNAAVGGYRLANNTCFPQEVLDSVFKVGEAVLDRIFSRMPEGIKAKRKVVGGIPTSAILEYADENKADMIIVGSRGLSMVKGALLGSVSQHLVEYASCPVMVVKENNKMD